MYWADPFFDSCFFRPYLDLVTKSSRILIVLIKRCVDNHLCFCFDSHIGVLTLFYLTSCFTYIYFSVLHLLLPVFPLRPFPLPSVSMNHSIETAFHNNSLFLIHLCFLPRYLKFQTQLHSSSFAVTQHLVPRISTTCNFATSCINANANSNEQEQQQTN